MALRLTIKSMIDYKKYIQVLDILKWQLKHDLTRWFTVSDFSGITDEMKASAICELFDTAKQSTQWIGWYTKPLQLWDFQNAPTPVPCRWTNTYDL